MLICPNSVMLLCYINRTVMRIRMCVCVLHVIAIIALIRDIIFAAIITPHEEFPLRVASAPTLFHDNL